MAHFDVNDIAKNLPFYLKLSPSRWPGSISCATFGAESTGYTAHGNDEMVCHLPWRQQKYIGKILDWRLGPERKEVFQFMIYMQKTSASPPSQPFFEWRPWDSSLISERWLSPNGRLGPPPECSGLHLFWDSIPRNKSSCIYYTVSHLSSEAQI